MSRWISLPLPLDVEQAQHVEPVMRALRKAAGLTQDEAAAALGGMPVSTLTSGELRGTAVQLEQLLRRAQAYGFGEVEIRVRRTEPRKE